MILLFCAHQDSVTRTSEWARRESLNVCLENDAAFVGSECVRS